MADYTQRLGLRLPDSSDQVTVQQDINWPLHKIDSSVGLQFCTTGTRPGPNDRYDGKMCYETDSRGIVVWDAQLNDWVSVHSDNSPQGPRGEASSNTMGNPFGNTETLMLSTSFNCEPRRRYMVESYCHFNPVTYVSGTNQMFIRFRWAFGASVTNADALICEDKLEYDSWNFSSNSQPNGVMHMFFSPNSAQSQYMTVGLFAKAETTNTTWRMYSLNQDNINRLMVRDYGRT